MVDRINKFCEEEYHYFINHKHPHIARSIIHLGCALHFRGIIFHVKGIVREIVGGVWEACGEYISRRINSRQIRIELRRGNK